MFVLMRKPDGKQLLVNLDLMFCVEEGEGGSAIAISIAGVGIPVGETFQAVLDTIGAAD